MSKNQKDVFLLRGFVRSGTNWLSRLVNLHPEINCQGEFHLYPFKQFQRQYKQTFNSGSCIYQNEKDAILNAEFNRFVKNIIRRYCEGDKYTLVGNRTPAGLNDMWLPHAKHLVISRDGRSVVTSWFQHIMKNNILGDINRFPKLKENKRLFDKDKKHFLKNPHDLLTSEGFFKEIVKRWSDRVIADNRVATSADNGEIGLDYHWVKYENLHMAPVQRRKEIYQYLGVDPDKANPIDDKNMPAYNAKKANDINNRGTISGWQNFFTPKQDAWFAEIAGQAMEIHLSKN